MCEFCLGGKINKSHVLSLRYRRCQINTWEFASKVSNQDIPLRGVWEVVQPRFIMGARADDVAERVKKG